MYYFYTKSNQGHGFCPLYRGCPPFGESVIRGFTVQHKPMIGPGDKVTSVWETGKISAILCIAPPLF